MLAIRLMRMGAKKRPSYRIVVKEKLSKRDGAYLESIGTYNPIGKEGEIRLNAARAQYWIERGAQPTETVRRLIKANAKNSLESGVESLESKDKSSSSASDSRL